MARPLSHGEPLVACSLRLPQSIVDRLQAEASAHKCSRSDVARAYFDVPADYGRVEKTGYSTPVSRPALAKPMKCDPELVRQLAWIGNNLNQIARRVNESGLSADNRMSVIEELVRIRNDIAGLEKRHAL